MKLWIEEEDVDEFKTNKDDNDYYQILKNKRENIYLNSVTIIKNNDLNKLKERDDYHLDDTYHLDDVHRCQMYNISYIKTNDKLNVHVNDRFKLGHNKSESNVTDVYCKSKNKYIRCNSLHKRVSAKHKRR